MGKVRGGGEKEEDKAGKEQGKGRKGKGETEKVKRDGRGKFERQGRYGERAWKDMTNE